MTPEADMIGSMNRALAFGEFLNSLCPPHVEWREHGQALAERGAVKLFPNTRQKVGQRARLIARLMFRDGEDCCYCLAPLGDDITLEHVVAQSRGGSDELDNLKLAHDRCNARMADLPPHAKAAAAKALHTPSTPSFGKAGGVSSPNQQER
jgi:hypothetical protein